MAIQAAKVTDLNHIAYSRVTVLIKITKAKKGKAHISVFLKYPDGQLELIGGRSTVTEEGSSIEVNGLWTQVTTTME